MVRLLGQEVLLIILSGLWGMYLIPALLGKPSDGWLFWGGVLMAVTFMPMYALSSLAGGKMPKRVRGVLGLGLWAALFWGDLWAMVGHWLQGDPIGAADTYLLLAPGLFGLVLGVLGALKASGEERLQAGIAALFSYSGTMALIRWLLLPMLGPNPVFQVVALQAGTLYTTARVLLRIFWPTKVEGGPDTGPLVRPRDVPDRVGALVERISHRRARGFATLPDGGRDIRAISILCTPQEAPAMVERIETQLAGEAFEVLVGEQMEGGVEVVVRTRS